MWGSAILGKFSAVTEIPNAIARQSYVVAGTLFQLAYEWEILQWRSPKRWNSVPEACPSDKEVKTAGKVHAELVATCVFQALTPLTGSIPRRNYICIPDVPEHISFEVPKLGSLQEALRVLHLYSKASCWRPQSSRSVQSQPTARIQVSMKVCPCTTSYIKGFLIDPRASRNECLSQDLVPPTSSWEIGAWKPWPPNRTIRNLRGGRSEQPASLESTLQGGTRAVLAVCPEAHYIILHYIVQYYVVQYYITLHQIILH